MSQVHTPQNEEHLADILQSALAANAALEVRGRGTKTALGRPMNAAAVLDLSAFSGVTLYEPEELILQAKAATPLAEIEAALAAKGQQLAFEPADLGPLLGGAAGRGSIGGALACNLSGPRRIKAGAARDHVLGLSVYAGRGELFKTGGRVVKNVTGYDLCKVMTGSYGTLGIMTDVTVKVLPAPEKTRSVLVYGLSDTQGIAALTKALASPHEVSGAAHLPAAIAALSADSRVRGAKAPVTAVRVEGPAESVDHRCAELRKLIGGTEELHSANSLTFWHELRDVRPFVKDARAVWRISVAPQAGPVMSEVLCALGAELFYDWGGGLIWAAMPEKDDAGAHAIRTAIAKIGGGHATLMRASAQIRAAVPVFQPQEEALAALTKRVKQAFDPNGILNPGRIVASM